MIEDEELVLVDSSDRPIGTGAKLEVHRRGLRHRAFSIFIWNADGKMLLQRRAAAKYHSGGLWANSCCGHPRVGEPIDAAANRRLFEELAMVSNLIPAGHYRYRAKLPNDLVENEFVHLFHGWSDTTPTPNEDEVQDVRWVAPACLLAELSQQPQTYTAWFRLYLDNIPERILVPPPAY